MLKRRDLSGNIPAAFVICCLLTGLILPTSHAQKDDVGRLNREAAQSVLQPTANPPSDLTEAVSKKRSGKGKATLAPAPQAPVVSSSKVGVSLSLSNAQAERGIKESLVGSARGVVRRGTVASQEASGPVYQKVPMLASEDEKAEEEEKFEKVNHGVPVPIGDGKKILDTPLDPPTPAITLGRAPSASMIDMPQRAFKDAPHREATTDFVYAAVRDIPTSSAPVRSEIGEPSVASMGNTIFYTGNTYAARSADAGATFSFVDPRTTLPRINNGFCCDQIANYAPAQDMLLWAVQYYSDGSSGTLRLARAVGSANVLNNQWRFYDFNPQLFGFPANTWMDFPGMTPASNYLYLSSNVFNNNQTIVGSVVWRVRLSELAAGGTINFEYYATTNTFAPRLTEGAGTTMYWAAHVNNSTIRIFHWDDAASNTFYDDVRINPYSTMGNSSGATPGVAVSPDGTNWAQRADSRILGAWVANGVIGFMWGASQDSTFPYPYTIVARFNQSTRAFISQNNIWNSQFAWLLPTASVNASGNLAGLLFYGGGPFYPSANIWISDDVQNGFSPLALYGATESNSGPIRNLWGDYHTVHPHKDFPNSWVASTYSMQNGQDGNGTVPRYLWFGRERDLGCNFSISPTSQSFGSGGGTGSVSVNASTSACGRTATSNASWLTIASGDSGTGSGTVTYSVAANTSSTSRTGTITIAGRTLTVSQSGSTCSFSISPASNSVPAGAANGSVAVTTGAGCSWTAASNVSWMSLTSGSTGTGSGTVGYSVAANTANVSRTGTLYVAGQVFTVSQAASGGGCAATPIVPGQTFNGTLSTSDCKLSDGSFFDSYTFNGSSGQQVVVKMASSAFDTYLFLLAPNGSVLTTNDDDAFGTNSRIPPGSGAFTLPGAGVYTILANSFGSGTTGAYTLAFNPSTTSTVQLAAPGLSVNEAERKVLINVIRMGDSTTPASVDYATIDGTADSRKDYSQTLGTLNFGVGETSKTVAVFITDDAFQESPETFSFTLSNPIGLILGAPDTSVVTINSNDTVTGFSPMGNAAFNNEFFVRQHYVDFLNREADALGLSFWKGQLDECETLAQTEKASCRDQRRQNVSAAFFLSPEFQDTGFYVVRMQRVAFGKRSDTSSPLTNARLLYSDFIRHARQVGEGFIDGAAGAQQKLEANKQAYAEQIVTSTAFATRFPQTLATAYVDALYASAGVVPTQTERQEAITAFGGGGTAGRTAALRKAAESSSVRSAEFRQSFVLMEYFGYMRRNPDQLGYDFWLGKLNNHQGNYISAEMVRSFIVSDEYITRFGQP